MKVSQKREPGGRAGWASGWLNLCFFLRTSGVSDSARGLVSEHLNDRLGMERFAWRRPGLLELSFYVTCAALRRSARFGERCF